MSPIVACRMAAISRRDQICEILANSSEPMRVAEIAAQMPYMWMPAGQHHDHALKLPHWKRYVHINGQCYLLIDASKAGRTQVRGDLLTLERRGMVEHLMYSDERRWRYVGPPLIDLTDMGLEV